MIVAYYDAVCFKSSQDKSQHHNQSAHVEKVTNTTQQHSVVQQYIPPQSVALAF